MGLFDRLFKSRNEESGPDAVINLDVPTRKDQLRRLESALDDLILAMQSDERLMDNPGWRGRVGEYSRAAAECGRLRAGALSRETILDLVFEIRPVSSGAAVPGQERIGSLQTEVMAIAEELRTVTEQERG